MAKSNKVINFLLNNLLRGAYGAGIEITGSLAPMTPTTIAQTNNHNFASFEHLPESETASPFKLLSRKNNWKYGLGIFLIIDILVLYITMGLEIAFRGLSAIISTPFRWTLQKTLKSFDNIKQFDNLDNQLFFWFYLALAMISSPFLLVSQPFGYIADIFLYTRELADSALHISNPAFLGAKIYESLTDQITPTPSARAIVKNTASSLIKLTPSLILTSSAIALFPELSSYVNHMISSVPNMVALAGITSTTAIGCKTVTAVTNEFMIKKLCSTFYTNEIREASRKAYKKEQREQQKKQSQLKKETVTMVPLEQDALLPEKTLSSPAIISVHISSTTPDEKNALQRTPHSKKKTPSPQKSPSPSKRKITPSPSPSKYMPYDDMLFAPPTLLKQGSHTNSDKNPNNQRRDSISSVVRRLSFSSRPDSVG